MTYFAPSYLQTQGLLPNPKSGYPPTLKTSQITHLPDEGDDGGAAADDTNEQITVPITDQDQRGANVGLNLALGLEEEVKGTLECPPGFTLNSNGQCERIVTRDPECPVEASTFNPETDKSEQRQTQPPI
jgi:hypothetical protein